MKHSIRFRFALILTGLTVTMLMAMWAINNWYLETFYVNEKIKVLEAGYAQLDRIAQSKMLEGGSIVDVMNEEMESQIRTDERISWFWDQPELGGEPVRRGAGEGSAAGSRTAGDSSNLLQLVRTLSEKNNITLVMIDSVTGKATRHSSFREGEWLAIKVQRYILGHSTDRAEILRKSDNYIVEKSFDPRNGSYYLESWGFFSDNRTLYIMSMPLASIQESVALSNRFLSYVGVAVLIIGCILMYITTSTITSPIKRLAALSEEMSELNFDAKYEGKAEDEIGVLGHSMNTLSDRLKRAIGELKKANLELQRDIAEKIQIDEQRKEFIANVSHELKTPIALIQGYAEGLAEGMCEDEENRSYYCDVIVDEADKMNQIVRQLLNLTELEFGNDGPNMERFDLSDLIRQFITSADILIQQSNASVILEVPETCFVWADEFEIEEVLANYLSNALNHLAGKRLIRIRVEPLGSEIKVSVFNTGEPIPEADISNLWMKFYKVDKARTREYGGSGIGLSIVKAIIDAHRKEVGASNKADGVEFWFTLDASKE